MTANLFNFVGTYKKVGNNLTSTDGTKLLISTRANTSKGKTPLFLVNKSIVKGGYVSSLYPTEIENQYNFDYKSVKYTIVVKEVEQIAEVKLRQSPLYINRTL